VCLTRSSAIAQYCTMCSVSYQLLYNYTKNCTERCAKERKGKGRVFI